MKSALKVIACCAVPFLATGAATAQNASWDFDASIYLFMPETKTAISNSQVDLDSTLSFRDALDNLDFAFMGALGARNGRWSVLLDVLYQDLSYGQPTSGPAFGDLNTSLTTTIVNGYVGYRVYEMPDVQVDVAAGFRWFDTETQLTLTPGTSGTSQSATVQNDWVDPLIGARARFVLSDKWNATVFADYGGFSSDSETWQFLLTADYIINDSWSIRGGYRYLSVDHTSDGTTLDFSQSGPIIGVTFSF